MTNHTKPNCSPDWVLAKNRKKSQTTHNLQDGCAD